MVRVIERVICARQEWRMIENSTSKVPFNIMTDPHYKVVSGIFLEVVYGKFCLNIVNLL